MQGYYYLFYSSGWFSEPYYNVRIAKAKSPTGPFIKKKLPILETNWELYKQVSQGLNVAMTSLHLQGVNTTFTGPGHCSVVEAGGDWWLVYHAWLYPGNTRRVVMVDPVTWSRHTCSHV